ncbi:LysR family transcriptional regulator [uncultured Cloacibacillus sp.]|uniref:LysR substrate-binding domain-containing protein n=1 Tax=uncultured Cloacibacillus sp. TaxID=889794 RepID=UPI0026DCCC07|nr:LysR family transcriptional regulator [uncultured Cloacibacillus sp.]
MDRKSLEQFIVIAETENISKAAESLNIAQPHLSRQLKKLEMEIGAELFERKRKRLHLTSAGRFLLKRGREITKLIDQTMVEVRSVKNASQGVLRIGTLESATMSFFPYWIAKFKERYPQTIVHMSNCGTTHELLSLLNENLVEVVIAKEPLSTVQYKLIELKAEPWVVIAPKDSPLSRGKGKVEPNELKNMQLLLPGNNLQIEDIMTWFHKSGIHAKLAATWTTLTGGIFLMRAGVGVLICTASGIQLIRHDRKNFVVRPIQFAEKNYKWLLLWNKNTACAHTTSNFLTFVEGQMLKNRKTRI